jgi:hypothetical protein
MKAQQAIAIVKDVMANAPHLLKVLGYGVFGVIFFGLTASALASATLDLLVNAAARFSAAIEQQLAIVQSDPAPADFAEKTVAYAEAALRDEMPELINIASGKEPRPLQLDRFAGAFSVAGEKQEKAADEKTLLFLGRFSGNPDIEKARAEFKRAQKIEETFHKDFDGVDFTIYSRTNPFSLFVGAQSLADIFRPVHAKLAGSDQRASIRGMLEQHDVRNLASQRRIVN